VYKKAFDISNEGRQDYTTGEITNLMSVDSSRLQNLTPYLHMVWSSLLQIAVSIYLLSLQVGWSVLAGLGFMILMVPLNIVLMKRLSVYQRQIMLNKDKRLKMMSEILNGIRIIKFFTWEESYIAAANGIRQIEVDTLRGSSYLRATTLFSWMVTPVFVALFTFLSFSLSGHELTASVAFTSVALFNVLRFPLNMLPSVLSNLVDSNIAMNRIAKYLNNDNRDDSVIEWNKVNDPNVRDALRMEGASFGWSPGKPVLHDLTFSVPKGQLVALVGSVGCGKSSVLSAFLGEMAREGGRAIINGSLAYASQQAWIQNASLKDNILFGTPYNAQRYQRVLAACQLLPDLDILPNGDETEIGEKGINLSGGQKQRVSLARAVYAEKDVYLLDDVLSAVDVHVGRSIFDQVLRGLLKGTFLFVFVFFFFSCLFARSHGSYCDSSASISSSS
jgi:ABC-type multidrug transport system fused ATPase/permease subunit